MMAVGSQAVQISSMINLDSKFEVFAQNLTEKKYTEFEAAD